MFISNSQDESKANEKVNGVMNEIATELKVETESPTNNIDEVDASDPTVTTKDHVHSFISKEKTSTAPQPQPFIFDQV